MRIPVYRSRIQTTNEAPGRAFQTRKRAQPFVQAALDKGAAGRALTSSIGDYALYRYNMAEQLKLDEASVKVQDELRNLAFDLSQKQQVNALDEDGLWYSESKKIKDRALAELGKNKNTLQKFNATYLMSESNNRFGLRNDLQSIKKTKIAETETKEKELIVSDLIDNDTSLPSGTEKIQEYNNVLGAFAYKQGQKITKLGYDPTVVEDEFRLMQKDIANGVLNVSVNNDPRIAANIISSKDDILEKRRIDLAIRNLDGAEMPEELRIDKAINDVRLRELSTLTGINTDYLVHTLSNIDEVDLIEITNAAFDDAINAVKRENEYEKFAEDTAAENQQTALEFYTAISLQGTEATFNITDFTSRIPSTKAFNRHETLVQNAFDGRSEIDAITAQELLKQIIIENGVSDQMAKVIEDRSLVSTPDKNIAGAHLDADDPLAIENYKTYLALVDNGGITKMDLMSKSSELTSSHFEKLLTRFESVQNETFTTINRNMRFLFDQAEDGAPPGAMAPEKFNGYNSVMEGITDFQLKNPNHTPDQLIGEASRLVKSFGQSLLGDAEIQITEAIERSLKSTAFGTIPDPVFQNNKLINEKEILDAMAQRIADAPESLLSKAQQQQADVLHQINFLNKLRRNVE